MKKSFIIQGAIAASVILLSASCDKEGGATRTVPYPDSWTPDSQSVEIPQGGYSLISGVNSYKDGSTVSADANHIVSLDGNTVRVKGRHIAGVNPGTAEVEAYMIWNAPAIITGVPSDPSDYAHATVSVTVTPETRTLASLEASQDELTIKTNVSRKAYFSIKAVYADGTDKDIFCPLCEVTVKDGGLEGKCTVNPDPDGFTVTAISPGEASVTVSYTENGVKAETTTSIHITD